MSTTLTKPGKKADTRVKIKPSDVSCNQPSASNNEVYCEKAEEFYEGLKRAIHDVNEHIAGRIQLRTLDEFLDEYQSRTNN